MTNAKAIEVIRENCYVFNPMNLDRTTLVNTALDTAIKALEVADLDGYSSRLWKAAYERGRADAEQRWIPVKERLPEDKTYVLVTIAVRGRQPHSRSSWYQTGAFHNDNGDYWRADEPEVVAWMPLPKPYKAESEDEE